MATNVNRNINRSRKSLSVNGWFVRRLLILSVCFLGLANPGWAEIVTEEINYESEDVELTGFVAWDDAITEKRPGIIVVHEWWGHNEYVRRRARMLAEMGYVALAIDMYGDGKVAKHPDQAGEFAAEAAKNSEATKSRFKAGLDILKNSSKTDSTRIAAIGYCFGGGIVLNMARAGIDLKGVVSFHGSLNTDSPAEKGKVKAKVLVCHGGADSFVPEDQITAFKEEMQNADVDLRFMSYPGAVHSFTNPDADTYAKKFGLPISYNESADLQSWQDMQDFLKEIFE